MKTKFIFVGVVLFATSIAAPSWSQGIGTGAPMTPLGPVGPAGPPGRSEASSGAGLPVDFTGRQAIDPTKNVEALVKALEEKTKELREADLKLIQAKLDSANMASELRTKHVTDLMDANSRRIDEIEKLRAELNDKLVNAERDRINAIRLVDVNAASDLQRRTSESAAALNTQTTQLANDLRTSTNLLADNLRTLVNTTAANQLAVQKQDKDETSKRLTTIEQALSEGRGKQQFQDPAISEMKVRMDLLIQQQSNKSGSEKGQSDAIYYILAALALGLPIGLAVWAKSTSHAPINYVYPQPPTTNT